MGTVSTLVTKEESNMIRRIASEVHKNHCQPTAKGELVSKEGLYHYGIQGLLEAKPKFKTNKNVPWLAFASYRVRGNMLDNVRRLPFIKLSYGQYKKVKELDKARQELLRKYGDVDVNQLSKLLGWTVPEVQQIWHQGCSLQTMSLSTQKSGQPGQSETMMDFLVSDGKDPEKKYSQQQIAEILQNCMTTLPAKDKFILVSRILKEMKLREIADILSCSPENIRRRQKKAQQQMEQCIKKCGWTLQMCIEAIT